MLLISNVFHCDSFPMASIVIHFQWQMCLSDVCHAPADKHGVIREIRGQFKIFFSHNMSYGPQS